MLHKSGALEPTSAPLVPQCTGLGRRSTPVRRWNRNASQGRALEPSGVPLDRNAAREWGAGTHQCAAGTAMLRKSGALEPTSPTLES